MDTRKIIDILERHGKTEAAGYMRRLEGMQGPEQGLVGEARSDSTKGHAEEAKPGRRGVGEIGGATELRRHLTDKIIEEHRRWREALDEGHNIKAVECGARHDALVELRADFDRIAEKRSDLSNEALPLPPPEGGSDAGACSGAVGTGTSHAGEEPHSEGPKVPRNAGSDTPGAKD